MKPNDVPKTAPISNKRRQPVQPDQLARKFWIVLRDYFVTNPAARGALVNGETNIIGDELNPIEFVSLDGAPLLSQSPPPPPPSSPSGPPKIRQLLRKPQGLCKCNHCAFSKNKKFNVVRHLRSHKAVNDYFLCNNCQTTYGTKYGFQRHECFALGATFSIEQFEK